MFRKTVFWLHLGCGVAVGLVVLMMSVTGVLLAYERQALAWVDQAYRVEPPANSARLPLSDLSARAASAGLDATTLTISADPAAPVVATAGREGRLHLNPYTGEVLPEQDSALPGFFSTIEDWHRWFNASGDNRDTARMVTGVSNLAFLFLVVSGLYLWVPKLLKWRLFKLNLWFLPKYPTSRARDYNWHHVFGIWSAIPLVVVIATAVVFSFSWANALVYRSFGEELPVRRGPPGEARGPAGEPSAPGAQSLDALFARAAQQVTDWKTLSVTLAPSAAREVEFRIDTGNGGQPQRRHALALHADTGEVVRWQPFSSQSAASRTRALIRFLHTGEALGLVGQTIAALVSFTTIFMVWTGFALAWRRLIQPLLRRRQAH